MASQHHRPLSSFDLGREAGRGKRRTLKSISLERKDLDIAGHLAVNAWKPGHVSGHSKSCFESRSAKQ